MISHIDWEGTLAAIWRGSRQQLRAVHSLDSIRLDDLLGIERQKAEVVRNTERFLQRLPANHTLLWGARGTGKSSMVKALLNDFGDKGLRVIEMDKDDLAMLPEIVDEIRELPYRFVVYCDDLSFNEGEFHYKHLKSVLQGSIEIPPENVLLYATSNRRNLMPETMADNLQSQVVDTELHYADAIEEKISLADRFGLKLAFHPINQDGYLSIVDYLFRGQTLDKAALHRDALLFAHARGARSGRAARQFYNSYVHP